MIQSLGTCADLKEELPSDTNGKVFQGFFFSLNIIDIVMIFAAFVTSLS